MNIILYLSTVGLLFGTVFQVSGVLSSYFSGKGLPLSNLAGSGLYIIGAASCVAFLSNGEPEEESGDLC